MQATRFEERLRAIEAIRDGGGLHETSAGGHRPPTGFKGVGTSGQAGFATSSRVGVTTNSLLHIIGDEIEIAAGSSLAVGSRETSSIKSAVPKFNGSGVEFPLWKRRSMGFALDKDCMQTFTTAIDMPVGDPSVTFRFLPDQGLSEASVRRARIASTGMTERITRIASTGMTERITDRELLSRVFDTNSPIAGWCTLCDWFLPKTLSEKSKWKR